MASATASPSMDPSVNQNVAIITTITIFATLSTFTLGTRLWSKKINRRGLSADDLVLAAGWAVCIGESVMIASATQNGLGYHVTTLSEGEIVAFTKAFFATSILLPTSLTLSKISVLMLLNHLFVTPAFRLATYILGAIVVGWWLAAVFGGIFICFPISAHWDPTVPAHCGNQQALDLGVPIPWIVTDFAILLCPLPVLKQLQISRGQKYGLFAMFLVGILTCIVSCVRYSTLFYTVVDPTWDIVPAAIWSVIEPNITVTCAALLASRPALAFFYPSKLISSTRARWQKSSSSRSDRRSHVVIIDSADSYSSNTPLNDVSRYALSSKIEKSQHARTSESS